MSEFNPIHKSPEMGSGANEAGREQVLAYVEQALAQASMEGTELTEGGARTEAVFTACTEVALQDGQDGYDAAASAARGRTAWEAKMAA